MCLPDTAEYWNDVKNHFKNKRPPFVHIKGFDCGHYHVLETINLNNVDCNSCKNHIRNNPDLLNKMSIQERKEIQNRLNKIKNKWKKKYPDNPDCSLCGFVMIKRINKKTGNHFYGCCQYPNCKNTLNIS